MINFKDDATLTDFATLLVTTSLVALGAPLQPGVADSLTASGIIAGGSLLARFTEPNRVQAEKVIKKVKYDLIENWREWANAERLEADGCLNHAVANFEEVISKCLPEPADLAGHQLNPGAIANLILSKAETLSPGIYSPQRPADPDADAARSFLLDLTRTTYQRLINEPGYIDTIAPQLWRELLGTVARIDQTTLETKTIAEDSNVMLRELLARTAPSLPLETAKAILTEFGHGDIPDDIDQIERLLRGAAEQYRLFEERLRELDNSGDLMVRDLLREAEQLVKQGQFDAADDKLVEAERHADLARAKVRANRGDLARLRLRYRDAANHYAKAARIVPEDDLETRWRYEMRRTSVLQDLGREYRNDEALVEAIDLYHNRVLPLVDKTTYPLNWAATQNGLGSAHYKRGEWNTEPIHFEKAIAAFRSTLDVWSREDAPLDWAGAQNNVGLVSIDLGLRKIEDESLENAVSAFRAALEVQSRKLVPLDWAMTQNNLGNALRHLGERNADLPRLHEAVSAYQEALKERTRNRTPIEWAVVQNSLCIVFRIIGDLNSDTDQLQRSVSAGHAALQEWTRERVPRFWGIAQNNLGEALNSLGNALINKGQSEIGVEHLKSALATFRIALDERDRERKPHDWALTQTGLGDTLSALGKYQCCAEQLEEAVHAYRAALEEHTQDRTPQLFASTKEKLSISLASLAHMNRGGHEEALAEIDEALELYRAAGADAQIARAESTRRKITGK